MLCLYTPICATRSANLWLLRRTTPQSKPLLPVQMGTARMGADRKRAVTDTRGESWDVRGLYVADASLFPSASGVNPMVTTEALAYVVAQNIAEDLLGSRPEVYSGAGAQKFEW